MHFTVVYTRLSPVGTRFLARGAPLYDFTSLVWTRLLTKNRSLNEKMKKNMNPIVFPRKDLLFFYMIFFFKKAIVDSSKNVTEGNAVKYF